MMYMPRKPTHRHVLRDLRTVLGMTQSKFADMLGVSLITVNRIENGSLNISRKIAVHVHVATGVRAAELMKGKTGKLLYEGGGEYTSASFDHWKRKALNAGVGQARDSAKNHAWWMEVLYRAAARGRANKLAPVVQTIGLAIDEAARTFKLQAEVEAILKEFKPVVKWQVGARTAPEMLEIENERLAGMGLMPPSAQSSAKPSEPAPASKTARPRTRKLSSGSA